MEIDREKIQEIISGAKDNGVAVKEIEALFKERELSNFQSDVRSNYAKKVYVWGVVVPVVFVVAGALIAIGNFALSAIKSGGIPP